MSPSFYDPLTQSALAFATQAHAGQVRKGAGGPYLQHPLRVATRLSRLPQATPQWVAAALLHDTLEDCGVSHDDLQQRFGTEVADLVRELTNPSKQFPELSRPEKKALDRAHVATVSLPAKMIKLIDRSDNLREGAASMDPEWLAVYVGESRALAAVLAGVHSELEHELAESIALAEAAAGST